MAHILLLPDASPLEVESVEVNDQLKLITVTASTTPAEAACPLCKEPSQRVHSRYSRTLADLPCCGQRVQWNVQVRRFRCLNASCTRKLFTERLPTWAPAYARRTLRQKEALGEVACELGGKVGQRIAVRVGMSISHDTPVRLVRQSGPAATSTARVVGVDDFAWKKGRRYGTILIDLERHQVIDLLPDREAERLAAWLKAHPEVEIISRDRAGAYAEGARTGAPSALQIADRFHLLLNLTEAVTRLCERKHEDLKHIHEQDVALDAAVPALAVQQETTAKPLTLARQQQQARHARRQNRYDEVKRLREQGVSQRAIATMLGLHRDPVHRYLTSTELPAMVRQPRRSKLDAYKDYLHQRSL